MSNASELTVRTWSATASPSGAEDYGRYFADTLLPQLREPGVTAVINGFASTPGTAEANYILSFERATAVAQFLEANGVPESSLIIVGHGATDLVGSGASGANRRVLVVIERA